MTKIFKSRAESGPPARTDWSSLGWRYWALTSTWVIVCTWLVIWLDV